MGLPSAVVADLEFVVSWNSAYSRHGDRRFVHIIVFVVPLLLVEVCCCCFGELINRCYCILHINHALCTDLIAKSYARCNIMLTFLICATIVVRNGNDRFVLRFTEHGINQSKTETAQMVPKRLENDFQNEVKTTTCIVLYMSSKHFLTNGKLHECSS